MIQYFEINKWYRFIKTKGTSDTMGWSEAMQSVLDGAPHKCINSEGKTRALFDCTPENNYGQNGFWIWSLSDFEEVPDPFDNTDDIDPWAIDEYSDGVYQEDDDNNKQEVIKMEMPKTKFELDALNEAKKKQIDAETAKKAEVYKLELQAWLQYEKSAREYRAKADELAKVLKITKTDMDNLL